MANSQPILSVKRRAFPLRRALASPYLALVTTTVIWGSQAPAGKLALRDIGPFQLVLARICFAGLALLAILVWQGQAGAVVRELRTRPRTMALLGFLSFFGSSGCSSAALSLLPASVSSLLSNVSPLFVALWVIAAARGRPRPGIVVGVIVGFVGLGLVIFGENPSALGSLNLNPLGVGLACLGSLSWAIYIAVGQRAMAKGNPQAILVASICFGGAPWLGLSIADGQLVQLFAAPALTWGLLLYVGVVGTGVAYALWTAALTRLSVATVAVFQYAIPFIAIVLSVLFLGEPATVPLVAGGVLIVTGIAVTQRATRGQSRPPVRDAASSRA
ncbi:MAG: DMT family transporter [Chloroflexota bacterium]